MHITIADCGGVHPEGPLAPYQPPRFHRIDQIQDCTLYSGLKGLDVVLPGKDDILLQGLLLGHACEGVLELGNTLLIRKRCI